MGGIGFEVLGAEALFFEVPWEDCDSGGWLWGGVNGVLETAAGVEEEEGGEFLVFAGDFLEVRGRFHWWVFLHFFGSSQDFVYCSLTVNPKIIQNANG